MTIISIPQPTVVSYIISVGSFFDRFDAQKWPVLSSDDVLIQALIRDCSIRKYIDLQRSDLSGALDLVIGKGFAIDKNAVLQTPCQPGEEP